MQRLHAIIIAHFCYNHAQNEFIRDKMNLQYAKNELKAICASMFSKNFFGLFSGSISMKIEHNKFIINRARAIFDRLDDDDFVLLGGLKDYRWKDANKDADVHLAIYKNVMEAKYVAFCVPAYLCAYSLEHVNLEPKDHLGKVLIDNIFIYDGGRYDDWEERAPSEVSRYMLEKQTNIMIVRGRGMYVYSRDLYELVRIVAVLENSCKLLSLADMF